MTGIAEALKELRPNSTFSVAGKRIKWSDPDNPQPTEKEINDKIAELQADYDAKKYQRDRKMKYPAIGDQLDMLFHAIDAGTLDKSSDFYTTIKAVKDKYPKG